MNISLQSPDKEIVYQAFHNEIWIMNIEPLKCPVHQERAACAVEEKPDGQFEVDLTVCCERLANEVIQECRIATERRNKIWS